MLTDSPIRLLSNGDDRLAALADLLGWSSSWWSISSVAHAAAGHGRLWPLLQRHLPTLDTAFIGLRGNATESWLIAQLAPTGKVRLIGGPNYQECRDMVVGERDGMWRAIVGLGLCEWSFGRRHQLAVVMQGVVGDAQHTEFSGFRCHVARRTYILKETDAEVYGLIELQQRGHRAWIDLIDYANERGQDPVLTMQSETTSLDLDWPEYYAKIVALDRLGEHPVFATFYEVLDRPYVIGSSLDVTETCQYLWRTHGRLAHMPDEDRKYVASTVHEHPVFGESGFFGSTFSIGYFKQMVNDAPRDLDRAIGHLPAQGPVTRQHIEKCIDVFMQLDNARIGGLWRLMCMKRPDAICNINNPNRAVLSDLSGITQQRLKTVEGQIDFHERIWKTAWFNASCPHDEWEYRVWRCRSALLDPLCQLGGTASEDETA